MNTLKYFIFGLLSGALLLSGYFTYIFKSNLSYQVNNLVANIYDSLLVVNIQNTMLSKADSNSDIVLSRENAITRSVNFVSPAIVGINVLKLKKEFVRDPFFSEPVFKDFFQRQYYNKEVRSIGSGFIYTSDGYIITNEHVIHNAKLNSIIVTTTGGNEYQAKIIGADEVSDIAILKIDVKNHKFARFGTSNSNIIGEWVIAFGNPYGLFEYNDKPLITVGVISGIDINFGRSKRHFYENMIQTDASINPGNSGGPLVNSRGEIIGVNTMIYSKNSGGGGSIGIGFAIPIDKIKEITNVLIKKGYIDRNINWGFFLKNVSDKDTVLFDGKNGVAVVSVKKGSAADKAGFKKNDLIIGVERIKINNFNDIKTALLGAKDYKVGDKVGFHIYRNKEQKVINMKLESY